MEDKKNDIYINSIKRAIHILNLYKGEIKDLGITEIGKAMNLHKSTVYRIVKTLESEGWLVKNKYNDKYKLGFEILDIACEIRNQYDHIDIALEEMKTLAKEIDETVLLSVYTNQCGICIEKVESQNRIKLTSQPGQRTPLHCGATGKILLAYQSDEDIKKVIERGLARYTQNTITDGNVLMQQMKEIRKKGYVISKAESDEGALGIGAPILDKEEKLIYGLSLAGPIDRLEAKGVDLLVEKVVEVANMISQKINLLL